jgi:transcriptional regulator with XRE-family HTH domain
MGDMTQAELAKKGNLTNPSLDVLKRLARVLGVPATELLE